MRRREFIMLIGGTTVLPLAARAQQPAGRVYRVGWLSIGSREQTIHIIKPFEEGLRSLGYRLGENVVIEYRFADGEMDRVPALARISHATECFCEVRWDFPMLRRAGMQDCGAECAARGLMFFGSPWASG
jgi:hypothetical protein